MTLVKSWRKGVWIRIFDCCWRVGYLQIVISTKEKTIHLHNLNMYRSLAMLEMTQG